MRNRWLGGLVVAVVLAGFMARVWFFINCGYVNCWPFGKG